MQATKIDTAPLDREILVYDGAWFPAIWVPGYRKGKGRFVGTHKGEIVYDDDGPTIECKMPTHWLPMPYTPDEQGNYLADLERRVSHLEICQRNFDATCAPVLCDHDKRIENLEMNARDRA